MKCYGDPPVAVRGVRGRLVFIWLVNKSLERVEENVVGLRRCGNYREIKKWEKLW